MSRRNLVVYGTFLGVWIFSFIGINHALAQKSGNPVFDGWYADPEGTIIDNQYWIYPTYSASYESQVYMDAFSSPDLVNWTKHNHVIDSTQIKWAKRAMWAPSIIKKENLFYLFFSANDIQNESTLGGIGIGVSEKPEGPFRDYLGKPLLNKIYNGAQPIDQFVFKDDDGKYYMIYGGWGHCNITRLKDDFTGFLPLADNSMYKEITPSGYTEGPVMFKRNGKYYFMWSEGGWTTADYRVAYAIGDTPYGPFKRIGLILQQNANIANGAGHHSVIQIPGTDEWYIVYHRRQLGETDGNSRVTCVDQMFFYANGTIKPVVMTFEGVSKKFLSGAATVYSGCGFTEDSLKLGIGAYSKSSLQLMGMLNGTSSIKLKEGYEVDLFEGDSFTGNELTLNQGDDCLTDNGFDDKTNSLVVRRKGEKDLTGIYYLQNKESGLFMKVQNESLSNGMNIVQDAYSGKSAQQFNLLHAGGGYYNLEAAGSKKLLSIAKSNATPGANLQQWDKGFADITNVGGVISTQYFDSPTNEKIEKLIDNSSSSKFLSGHSKIWIQFHVSGKATVTDYSLTSANDSPERDPLNWVLSGSDDKIKWDTLDVRNGEDFATRYLKKSYTCKKSSAYEYYRLDMTNNSGINTQLAELELLGRPVGEYGFENQQFLIQAAGNGYYKIYTKFSDQIIEESGVGSGSYLRQWGDENQASGLWKIRTPEEMISAVEGVPSNPEISIYPNPATDVLQVNGLQSPCMKSVYNLMGVPLFSTDKETVDVSGLHSGVYVLRLHCVNKAFNLMFIKK